MNLHSNEMHVMCTKLSLFMPYKSVRVYSNNRSVNNRPETSDYKIKERIHVTEYL
jgi:hypothetical protein